MMNLLFWKTPKQLPLPEFELGQRLNEIKRILFPPLELHDFIEKDGTLHKYHVDYCADSNLEAVLNDLQDDISDPMSQDTLNSVIKRLLLLRKILSIEVDIDKEAEYIEVRNLDLERNIENIR